jgi:hypothetical protein
MARGQFADVGYAQLLIQFDRNGNGLLEDHERAAMLAASREQAPQPLSAFPLICEGQTFGGFGGAVARVEQQQESPPLPRLRGTSSCVTIDSPRTNPRTTPNPTRTS